MALYVNGFGPVPDGQDLIVSMPKVMSILTGILAVRIGIDRRATVIRADSAATADIDLSTHDVSSNEGILRLAQAIDAAAKA